MTNLWTQEQITDACDAMNLATSKRVRLYEALRNMAPWTINDIPDGKALFPPDQSFRMPDIRERMRAGTLHMPEVVVERDENLLTIEDIHMACTDLNTEIDFPEKLVDMARANKRERLRWSETKVNDIHLYDYGKTIRLILDDKGRQVEGVLGDAYQYTKSCGDPFHDQNIYFLTIDGKIYQVTLEDRVLVDHHSKKEKSD